MLKPPDKLDTPEDVMAFITHLLEEMEELVQASMRVQELYNDLVVMSKENLEEIAHLKRIIWGDGNETSN